MVRDTAIWGTPHWRTNMMISLQITACTMIFDDSVYVFAPDDYPCLQSNHSSTSHSGWAASASAWLPLTYDTIVLALTLYKTLGPIRKKTAGKIARVLLRDGILYYR